MTDTMQEVDVLGPKSMQPRVTAVETFVSDIQPNVCLVKLETSDGLVGWGETFYGAPLVEAYIHQQVAPVLMRMAAPSPESAAGGLSTYVGYQGSGAETRGNSAVDIALWDLVGKRAGLPLREILGGPAIDSIGVYNTCAGVNYVNGQSRQSSTNWGLASPDQSSHHEDLWRFLHEPAQLARDLVDTGMPGMKVWPFDLAAESSRGDHHADLRDGLRVLEAIRGEVGMEIDLYIELHSLWTLRGAKRLMKHLEEFNPLWVEDPIRADRVPALTELRRSTGLTIAVGESIAGRSGFKPLLDAAAIDVAILDIGWTGGITEARKIASMADVYGVPIAPHDCTGPVALAAAVHLATSQPNGMVQEIARAFYSGWYEQMVVELPPIVDGRIRPTDGPGLGVEIRPEFLSANSTRSRRSTL